MFQISVSYFFTIHFLVPRARLELARLSPGDFKSPLSTNSKSPGLQFTLPPTPAFYFFAELDGFFSRFQFSEKSFSCRGRIMALTKIFVSILVPVSIIMFVDRSPECPDVSCVSFFVDQAFHAVEFPLPESSQIRYGSVGFSCYPSPAMGAYQKIFPLIHKYPGPDLDRHAFRHESLSLAGLPIPPPGHKLIFLSFSDRS